MRCFSIQQKQQFQSGNQTNESAARGFPSNVQAVISQTLNRIRIAAIDFLNPAPLMWDFEHPPHASQLAERYAITRMKPAECAVSLLRGTADLGLIPIAALTPEFAVVPGSAIAALDRVRSIQLIVKRSQQLEDVRTIAADTASRSSLAYAQILFNKFLGTSPEFIPSPADPIAMLTEADAALLIGDPALFALEARAAIEQHVGPCEWFDLAHEWKTRTGLPWVAAVWAVRPEVITEPGRMIEDLNRSRVNGMAHTPELVTEWATRLALPPTTIQRVSDREYPL